MSSFFGSLLNKLDLTAQILLKPKALIATLVILTVLVMSLAYLRRRRKVAAAVAAEAAATALPQVSAAAAATADARSPTYSRAVYLARESAKLVAQAIEAGSTDVLRAYAGAVQASVLAQTAKELVDDMDMLSRDLGVDMFEYVSYTSNVLSDAQDRLTAAMKTARTQQHERERDRVTERMHHRGHRMPR